MNKKNLFSAQELWDKRYQSAKQLPLYDGWLDEFAEEFQAEKILLEIGIGSGPNLPIYHQLAKDHIYGCDISGTALEFLKIRVPGINLFIQDIRDPFRVADAYFDIIVADLCLHYFNRKTTKNIIDELRRLLIPAGKIFLRVNKVGDSNSCYKHGVEIEPNFFRNSENEKAFYTPEILRSLFAAWNEVIIRPNFTEKFGEPKHCLMAVFEK